MSLAILYSRASAGIDAPLVTVEVQLAQGLPSLSIVGLPELAVRESKDRVRGALESTNFQFPAKRIIINLAPADLPKEGGRFDLAIALGILGASKQIPNEKFKNYEFLGELALSGDLRPVTGVLPAALRIRDAQRTLMVPEGNAQEAALVNGLKVLTAKHLLQICQHFAGTPLPPFTGKPFVNNSTVYPDLIDVRGQLHAKRALEIAAAGGHSLLLYGPPGTGKSMLASRLPGLLPPMTEAEALETAAVLSISNQGFDPQFWCQRPFRSPHHTASGAAMVGGGSSPKPGEISLAHCGVLFLDELPEFNREVLEVLREPMENGRIIISRAARQAEFPARFQLISAMNPCPCGYLGDPITPCRCSPKQINKYRTRLSGPLLDRIDMHVETPRISSDELMGVTQSTTETSAEVRKRIVKARERQLARNGGRSNHDLDSRGVEYYCKIDPKGEKLMRQAMERLGLSARAFHRVLKIARTIADIMEEKEIRVAHLSEAIGYRRLDRNSKPEENP
ncbi:ATP-dependent protease [Achromatium sp. WMS2]|nr:ATP-dependent protease [Achromatium sp. WMS2]